MTGTAHGRGSHSDVLETLGRRIATGELPEGRILTLADLELEHGASRTVIREAVRVLESRGMLASRRRVGITVLPHAEWDAFDAAVIRWNLAGPRRQEQLAMLTELRGAIDPTAARLAAVRASFDDRARLRQLGDELDALGRRGLGASAEYLEVDVAFHRLLLEASGNAMLAQLASTVEEVLRGRAALGLTPAKPAEGTLENHVATAAAISASDAHAAEAGARTYVSLVALEVGDPVRGEPPREAG